MKLAAAVLFCLFAARANAATFSVTTTADSGPGSLRQAIADANAAAGLDTIDFSIGSAPQTITLLTPIVVTSPIVLDGTTQEGASIPQPIALSYGINALRFEAGSEGSVVRALAVTTFQFPIGPVAIWLDTAGNITVAGCLITGNGIAIRMTSSGNVIGGPAAADRNVVSDNETYGLEVTGDDNLIAGNFVGVDPSGKTPLGNGVGISMTGASNTVIRGNVISANTNGINGSMATSTRIEGNYIGVDADGFALPAPRQHVGISLIQQSNQNVIGGSMPAARNLISNNDRGISIGGNANVIEGNYIGTNAAGTAAIPNQDGVYFAAAVGVVRGNVVSGNLRYGLIASEGTYAIQGNYIGVDATGMNALPNGLDGIACIDPAPGDVLIGGASSGQRNVISGNGGYGIRFLSADTMNVIIQSNLIGVAADGTTAAPNAAGGIRIDTALTRTLTGGANAGEGNVIAHNGGPGVAIAALSTRNTIRGNSIFANAGLGIDLSIDGPTPNDPLDADTGGNLLQNFPVLSSATLTASQLIVTGSLDSTPSAAFTLDLYANSASGQQFHGSQAVTTNATGQASFTLSLPLPAAANATITATATDAQGNTSEFSTAIVAAADVAAIPVLDARALALLAALLALIAMQAVR